MNNESKTKEPCVNPAGYCGCGCGAITTISAVTDRGKGYQKGCPRLYITGHNRRTSGPHFEIDERGCWIWLWSRNGAGYGRIRDGKKMRPAHVVWYERHIGPIPAGQVLHHLCER